MSQERFLPHDTFSLLQRVRTRSDPPARERKRNSPSKRFIVRYFSSNAKRLSEYIRSVADFDSLVDGASFGALSEEVSRGA